MKLLHASIAALACLAAAGCARFAIYEDAQLTKETGLRLYTPKPYLLVPRTARKEKPMEVSVVYLPDLSRPYYVQPKSGLGSANLSLDVTNGMITKFGQQTDTKIPELLNSVSSLATALGARSQPGTQQADPVFELYEVDTASRKLKRVK